MDSKAGAGAHSATTRIVNGPVPANDPSHALRLEAAKDLVERCKRQLAAAEAELARVIKESPLKT
jgi:hypothetical protein